LEAVERLRVAAALARQAGMGVEIVAVPRASLPSDACLADPVREAIAGGAPRAHGHLLVAYRLAGAIVDRVEHTKPLARPSSCRRVLRSASLRAPRGRLPTDLGPRRRSRTTNPRLTTQGRRSQYLRPIARTAAPPAPSR
jgi:hypothetical protein